MSYQRQLDKVIQYIGIHLDEKLSLDHLSEIACFSKYHFHRIFTAYTGLTSQQFIRWLRLKRAAHQLIVDKKQSIIDIAINAGFESHEAFTRAFKQSCGMSPSQFKKHSSWHIWEKAPYRMPQQQGEIMTNVTIQNKKARRLAVLEHRGAPEKLGHSVNQLINWAKTQTISIKPTAGDAFGFAYDDPATTKPENFRFDLALTVPENLKLNGDIIEKRLPAGSYAIAIHHGSRDTIDDTIYGMYRDWLPNSGEELGDLPCIFCYHNFDHEVAETELVTEIWLLLKDKS